jgi:hypothetical protein
VKPPPGRKPWKTTSRATSESKPLFGTPLIRVVYVRDILWKEMGSPEAHSELRQRCNGIAGRRRCDESARTIIFLWSGDRSSGRCVAFCRHGLSDIFDQIETGSITVSDVLYLVWTAILVGAGFVLLRRAWRALAIMHPGRWLRVPRLGWRGMILAVLAFGGAIALVCQYGDLPWLAGRLVDSLWLAVKAAYANRDALWQAVLAIDESRETIGQVAKGILGAVATYVTLKFAWVAVDFALSIIRVALPIMSPVARYGHDGYKHAREWLPHVELTPRKIDWLHGAGSLAAGSIFGFESLSLPSIPTLLWASSVPGLFLFLRTRPNLLRRVWRIGYCVGRHLNHYVSIATECAHSHPRAARSIGAGAMVAVAGVDTLHAFSRCLQLLSFRGFSRLPIRQSKSH